jgi:alkaline phosphatase D
MRRRTLLRIALAGVGDTLAGSSLLGGQAACSSAPLPSLFSELTPNPGLFPQSVASGDPKARSVVLWTRTPTRNGKTVRVYVQVAEDEGFTKLVTLDGQAELELTASEESDFCVRIRVDGLEPAMLYFYRFVRESADGEFFTSRVGRTKTAALRSADTTVRFAVISCQDYTRRYYHTLRRLAELDLDFIVHLGDYVYETTAASDQDSDSKRAMRFDDVAGVLRVTNVAGTTTLAARSLDNYRNLYRVFRSDPDLQTLHERFAMIAVYDDHEFSNDGWGANATYTDGAQQEMDKERRANADRAWFEYMPVDYDPADFQYDVDASFPDNLRIYRDFRFGQHLHLVLTDLRRYRADHVIPENAFPGAMALTAATFEMLTASLTPGERERAEALALPYINVDEYQNGEYRKFFSAQDDEQLAFPSDVWRGNISVPFINQTLSGLNDADAPPRLDENEPAFERGIAYHQLGKTELYSSFGSRYFIDQEVFSLIAKQRYLASEGESERVMGSTQEQWFLETLKTSEHTWKVWGNEFTLMPKHLNLDNPLLPEALRHKYQLSADDWDGAPMRRAELLKALASVNNLIAVTGDIHSFLVGEAGSSGGKPVFEFVCGAVSSATFQALIGTIMLPIAGLDSLIAVAGPLLQDNNPHLAFQDLETNGFASFEVGRQEFNATLHLLPFERVTERELPNSLASYFTEHHFRVKDGALQRKADSGYQTWNRELAEWIG